ncbi:MAG: four helix bundle protein [Gemmatimonadota bacterium]
MGDFKKLTVWQRAYAVSLATYRLTAGFPVSERYGLSSQLRRAAISIPSNIAEGCARRGDKELIRFLTIARGSTGELECQLLLARDLGFLSPADWEALNGPAEEISRMLGGLISSLRPDETSRKGYRARHEGRV